MSEPIVLPRSPGVTALRDYLNCRLQELREELEHPHLDGLPLKTIAIRAQINEIKEIFDLFGFPAA